jgi:hypothetical protein
MKLERLSYRVEQWDAALRARKLIAVLRTS